MRNQLANNLIDTVLEGSSPKELVDRLQESAAFMKDEKGNIYSIDANKAEQILINAGIPFGKRGLYKVLSGSPEKASPNLAALKKLGKKKEKPFKPPKSTTKDPSEAARKKFDSLLQKEAKNWKGWAKSGEATGSADDAAMDAAHSFVNDPSVKKLLPLIGMSAMLAQSVVADEIHHWMSK
jgi:hypothetical protein